MTAQTRANLKARFQTGDRPNGADFEDLIDSSVNLQDVSAQVYVGSIQAPGIVVSTVSADAVYTSNFFVSAFSVATVSATNANIGTLSATAGNIATLTANAANIATLSAGTVIAETVRASAVRHKNPHAHIYIEGTNFASIAGASAYRVIPVFTTADAGAMLGFSHNGTGRVTYTGSVTARMHVSYNHAAFSSSAVAAFEEAIFKNSAFVTSSRIIGSIDSSRFTEFHGDCIVEMKTNDFLELNIKTTAYASYDLHTFSYQITVRPVSFDF